MYYALNKHIFISKEHGHFTIGNIINGDILLCDEVAYIFLSALSYVPQRIGEITDKILPSFADVTKETLLSDATEYFEFLSQSLIIAKGNTEDECVRNQMTFTYGNKQKIINAFHQFEEYNPQEDISGEREILLKSLHIELTSKCNERCVHCYIPNEMKIYDMNHSTFEKIVRAIKEMGIKAVTISGGECMVHPNFEEWLKVFKSLDLDITILSNLTSLSDGVIDILTEGRLTVVQTTIFSMNPKIHDSVTQVEGSWHKTMANIQKLRENNILLKVATQCFSETIQSIPDIMKWCGDQGYQLTVDWDIVGKINGDTSMFSHRVQNDEMYKKLFECRKKTAPSFLEKLYAGCNPEYHVCNIGVSSLSINPYGEIFPCVGFVSQKLGNINDISLKDIWNGEKLEFLRNIKLKDIPKCATCVNKDYCYVCMQCNAASNGKWDVPDENKCYITKLLKEFALDQN